MISRKNIFHSIVFGFKAETLLLELHLAKYVKRYSMKLNSLGYIYLRVICRVKITEIFLLIRLI